MPVYTATAPTYASPTVLAVVGGQPLVRVGETTVTRGWDQDLATASVTIPYPPPATVGHRAMIRVYMGTGVSPTLRFVGYITSIDANSWPERITLDCEDLLALAKYYKPTLGMSIAGMTDQQAVKAVLNEVGLPYTDANIGGTGKVFGDDDSANPALHWDRTATALSFIQQIDQVSVYETIDGFQGIYRTYCDAGGVIRRIALHPLPAATPARTFSDGVDVIAGSLHIEAVEPSRVATAAGNGGLSVTATGDNPFAVISNPQYGLFPLLGVVDGGGTELDLTSMATYLLQQYISNLVRIDFATTRDDLIGAYETQRAILPYSLVDIKALVQSVTMAVGQRGGFTQQVSLVSYRELNIFTDEGGGLNGEDLGPFDEFDPFDGGVIPPEGFPELPEPEDEAAIIPSFNVNSIAVEKVLVAGEYVSLYTVPCEDTSTSQVGTITAWAWEAGGGGLPASGSEPRFSPSWEGSLDGATVTLTVTDSEGNTATTPAVVITMSMGAPVRVQKLHTAEGEAAGEFDGTNWLTDANSGGVVDVVGNGPIWAAADKVQYGDLVDTPDSPESTVSSGLEVTALWVERDVSTAEITAGLEGGRVYRSSDSGATWAAKTLLDVTDEDVLQVILSRDNPGQIWALQASNIWISYDDGSSWGLIRTAAVGQSFISLRLSGWRNLVSSTGGPAPLETAEAGTPFTFTGGAPSSVTGIAFNVYADEVCVLSGDTPPAVYVTDAPGSFNMVAAEVADLSAYSGAAPYPRNVQHDGSVAREVYAAVGDWALKSTDFFKTDTVHVLRHVGEGGAGAGPIVMIGIGDLAQQRGGGGLYVAGNGVARYDIATDTWTDVTPPVSVAVGLAAYGDHVWVGSEVGEVYHSADRGDNWTSIGAPSSGAISHLFTDGTTLVAIQDDPGYTIFDPITSSVMAHRPIDGSGSWTTLVSGTDKVFGGSVVGSRVWFARGAAGRNFKYLTIGGGTTSTDVTTVEASQESVKAASGNSSIAYGCLAYDGVNPGPGRIWRFVDGSGTDVTPAGGGGTTVTDGFIDVAPNADDSVVLARQTVSAPGESIYRSTDHGASWSMVFGPESVGTGDHQSEIAWSPTTPGVVAMLRTSNTVLISFDSGATWFTSSAAPTNGRFAVAVL